MNECLVAAYPYGPQLRLLYGGLDVTFTTLAGNFRSEGGRDRISRHGYDRAYQKDTTPKAEASLLGSPLIKGVPYGKKYEFGVRLQMLTNLQLDTTLAIFEMSSDAGELITIYDQRLVTREPSPRTRAKVGTVLGAPTVAGMEYYYGQYRAWVTQWSEPYRMEPNLNYLDFAAIEIGPPIAPGIANDIP